MASKLGNRKLRRIQERKSKVKMESINENEGLLPVTPKSELYAL